jgi:hypothetical protein
VLETSVPEGLRVLVTGANFRNQGAYLMLVAVAQEIRSRFAAVPVLDLRMGDQRQKASIGAETLWTPKLARRFGVRGGPWFPDRTKGRWPYLMASQVDAVMDVSGFRYADAWVDANLMHWAGYLDYWAGHGVPVYMLPQAFGPFEQTSAPAMRALCAASVVMPRDPDSEAHVRSLLGTASAAKVIERFPDFTVTVPGRFPSGWAHLRGGAAVVPNWNIASRGSQEDAREKYVAVLVSAVGHLRQRGLRAYGLSHEGKRDLDILLEVASRVSDFEVVSGLDGVASKGLLGTARVVVSGRFHALVSALSQGVPCVLHGWSHKYRWLAEDYGTQVTLADPYDQSETARAIAAACEDDGLRASIEHAGRSRVAEVEAMWGLLDQQMSRHRR